jgi:hypothetical protein
LVFPTEEIQAGKTGKAADQVRGVRRCALAGRKRQAQLNHAEHRGCVILSGKKAKITNRLSGKSIAWAARIPKITPE